jgi:hypothetical protein
MANGSSAARLALVLVVAIPAGGLGPLLPARAPYPNYQRRP